jgi:hypothetical protein
LTAEAGLGRTSSGFTKWISMVFTVLFIFGTGPEVIKLALVIGALAWTAI